MYNRNFRSIALVSVLSTLALTGCGSKAEVVGPDPALSGSAQAQGGSAPANTGTSTDAPPPNSKKKGATGTLQDKACNSTLLKDGFAGMVRTVVKFTDKKGQLVIVDPCVDGGAVAVSFEKFKTKSGREDYKIISDSCVDEGPCWFRVYTKAKKPHKTLAELKLAGSYKDGEALVEIPSDALFMPALYADSEGNIAPETNRVITKYVYQGSKPTDLAPVMARLDKLDQRMTDAEGKISGLVIAMAAYSQKTAMEEAM